MEYDIDPPETEEEYQDRRSELIKEAKKTKKELNQEQKEILDEISSEHGGERVETRATIAGDYSASISVNLNGKFINRLSAIENKVDNSEDFSIREIEETMDEASQILADIIDDPEYDKDLFYSVYQEDGPTALGKVIQNIFSSIEEEQKRKAGAIDGFRNPGGD